MGVRSLTTYVKHRYCIFYKKTIAIRGAQFIFDGDGLLWFISDTTNKLFGGDYNDLDTNIRCLFHQLTKFNIQVFIVFDGTTNIPLKLETCCKRKVKHINLIQDAIQNNTKNKYNNNKDLPNPLFLKQLFMDVLRDMHIPFVVAPNEADLLIGTLANMIGCPVISNDSDFFLMKLTHGVIPFTFLSNLDSNYEICVYRFEDFCQHLAFGDEFLSLIAIFLGNDYSENLSVIQSKCGITGNELVSFKMQQVCNYVKQFNSSEEVISDLLCKIDYRCTDLKSHIETVLAQYDVSKLSLKETGKFLAVLMNTEAVLPQIKYDSLTMSLKEFCRLGLIQSSVLEILLYNTYFAPIQCENIFLKSAACCSKELRNVTYALLLPDTNKPIVEYRRSGRDYKPYTERFDKIHFRLLNSTNKDRLSFLFKLARVGQDRVEIPLNNDTLLLLSFRHWILRCHRVNDELSVNHITALVTTYICLKYQVHCKGYVARRRETIDAFLAHRFCQWQCILMQLQCINVLLKCPVKNPHLSCIFSGTLAHYIYGGITNGEDFAFRKDIEAEIRNYVDLATRGLRGCINENE